MLLFLNDSLHNISPALLTVYRFSDEFPQNLRCVIDITVCDIEALFDRLALFQLEDDVSQCL